jgi:hypothetical protein
MKLFLSIFAAVILAAILGGLYGRIRYDRWDKAIDAVYAQSASEHTAFQQAAIRNQAIDWNKARDQETQTYRLLAQLLENKPFGIPLDQEEQADLDGIRVELARRDP